MPRALHDFDLAQFRGACSKVLNDGAWNQQSVFCASNWRIISIFGSIMGAIFGKGSAQASASPTAAPSAPPAQTVDVAAIVDKAAAATGEKLAWRTSIVDLMKALNLDSSLAARKQLAKELNYTGDTNDSATMNVWLHKQIMAKLAANGGKLPADIKT